MLSNSPYLITGENARWRVMWVGRKGIVSKDFENDLAGALRLYTKAAQAGKRGATLNCRNIGFPPPENLRPHVVTIKVRTSSGKRVREERLRTPLKKLNIREGVWWCPYCCKLRKFVKQRGYESGSMGWIAEPGYHCPLCQVSHRDHHVRKWNPVAGKLAFRAVRRSRSTKTRRRKRA